MSLATAILIGSVSSAGLRSYHLAAELQHDTRDEMGAWMVKNLPINSEVYLDWKRYGPTLPEGVFKVTYIPRAKLVETLDINKLKSSGKSYLVLSSLFYDRYFSQPHPHVTVRERIRQVFERVPIVKEFRPEHGTYGFHNPTLTVFSLKAEDFERLEQELAEKRAAQRTETSNDQLSNFPWRIP